MTCSKLYTLISTLFIIATLSAANCRDTMAVYQGYSGGMLVHAGYLFGAQKNAPVAPEGMTIGIGLLLVCGCIADGHENMFKRESSSRWYRDADAFENNTSGFTL